ncbi:hypothetical protein [Vibrio fluvialis]|uniref:hypothetical protein n=1 Tax=Vibrio fluvialis TaxID=676 RepID=UPI0025736E8D|nr:hypothetical protein [Vibrio fluvialis]BEI26574.1 hypothetical protein KKIDH5335_49060 [Vibrio fluvialis]
MELKAFIVADVNEMVRDWIGELSLIKFESQTSPDFIVDIQATKAMNGNLNELLTLVNANTSDSYCMHELINCQYMLINQLNEPSE